MNLNEKKRSLLLELLDQGIVMLHLDARHPGVSVPAYLKSDHHLRLNLSYRFDLPDLSIQDDHLSVTLSFRSHPFPCVLPFDALWGLSPASDPADLRLFPASLPPEIVMQMFSAPLPSPVPSSEAPPSPVPSAPLPSSAPPPSSVPESRPTLRLIVNPDADAPPSRGAIPSKGRPSDTPRPIQRAPFLRIVEEDDETP